MTYCVLCDYEFYGDNSDEYVCISCVEHICENCRNICPECHNCVCNNCVIICDNCDNCICIDCGGTNHENCDVKNCAGCDFKINEYKHDFITCSDDNCNKIFCTSSGGGNECDISNNNLIKCFKCEILVCMDHRIDLGCIICNELENCICYYCFDNNMNIDEIIKSNTKKCENDCWIIKDCVDFYYININTIYCSDHYVLYYNDKMKKIIDEINDAYLKCDVVIDNISEFILM